MGNKTTATVRLVMALLTVGNVVLMSMGASPIEIDEGMVAEAVSAVLAIGAVVYAWWKNSSFSKESQASDGAMKEAKGKPVKRQEAQAMKDVGVEVKTHRGASVTEPIE